MKHRWIAIAAVMATLVLAACRPADGGAGNSSAPATTTTTTTSAEPSASSTPYVIDEY
jgi:hypothetical protein